jgi:HEAT repeat protein
VLLLGEFGSIENGPQVFERLQDREPVVRAAAVEAYCALGEGRAIRAITRFLDDVDSSVRAAAVVGLIRYGGLDGVLSSAERLKKMLESEKAHERAIGARILGDVGVKNFYHPLLALLVDPESQVRIAAIEAAGKMQSRELLPALIYRIEDPGTRSAACLAVAAYGASAVELLERVLGNVHEPLATRLAVPSILSRIGDQQSMDVLIQHITDPTESLRTQVLEGIHRMRLRRSHIKVPEEAARNAAMMEIRNLYQQWFVRTDLKKIGDGLLLEALEHRRNMTVKRVFRLLGCIYPVRAISTVFNNLTAPRRRIRANAIEVLDNMLDKELKRLLLPLLDKSLLSDLKEIGDEIFGLSHRPADERLRLLMEENTGWLSSCAIFSSGQNKDGNLSSDIRACMKSENPLVRETALVALRNLLPPEDVQEEARTHLDDPAPNVREYATWILQIAKT